MHVAEGTSIEFLLMVIVALTRGLYTFNKEKINNKKANLDYEV